MVLRRGRHSEQGKCDSCGFLSKRLYSDIAQPECREASLYDRDFGMPPYLQNTTTKIIPWCFVGEVGLHSEVEDLCATSGNPQNACLVAVIISDRHCPMWFPWTEFLSPKEHFEKYQMTQLEQRQKEFQQTIEQERKDFDLKLFEMDQRIQSDNNETAKRADKFNRRMTWFFIILAILSAAGTILALFFPNGF